MYIYIYACMYVRMYVHGVDCAISPVPRKYAEFKATDPSLDDFERLWPKLKVLAL